MNRFEQFFKLTLDKPILLENITSQDLEKIGAAFITAMAKAFDANLIDARELGTAHTQESALKKTLFDINEFVQKAAQKNPEIFAALMPGKS